MFVRIKFSAYICTQIYAKRRKLLEKSTEKYQNSDTCHRLRGMQTAEIKRFSAYMAEFGASERTIADRIRYRSFLPWEIVGVNNIIREYAENVNTETNDTQRFLCSLGKLERGKFYALMRDMGMSANTVRTRFFGQNFRPWEMIGIEALFEEWQGSEKHRIP